MKRKTALITGITGMDGSTLADMLLKKDYNVIGVMRRNATSNLENAKHLENNIDIVEGDITDTSSMLRIIDSTKPHELYHTAAMSHVHTSFEQPLATIDIDTKGLVNILEVCRLVRQQTRILHCSTSEMFGTSPSPQGLETTLTPQSPYAIAKVASHHFVKLYRQAYKMYICAAITFNHEGPRRGPNFVTRKISIGVSKALADRTFKLKLGNLDAKRDWGLSSEYCEGFWLALQQENANDYIFSTGESHSISEFCKEAFSYVGLNWENHVEVHRFYMRPAEVPDLCGDYSKTKELLGWEPKVKFKELVRIMVDADCKLAGLIKEGETAEYLAEKLN